MSGQIRDPRSRICPVRSAACLNTTPTRRQARLAVAVYESLFSPPVRGSARHRLQKPATHLRIVVVGLMLRETLFKQEVSPRTPRDTNNTECIRGIRDCKVADISKTVVTMLRNNMGRLAQHRRVTERAHRPIQATACPGVLSP